MKRRRPRRSSFESSNARAEALQKGDGAEKLSRKGMGRRSSPERRWGAEALQKGDGEGRRSESLLPRTWPCLSCSFTSHHLDTAPYTFNSDSLSRRGRMGSGCAAPPGGPPARAMPAAVTRRRTAKTPQPSPCAGKGADCSLCLKVDVGAAPRDCLCDYHGWARRGTLRVWVGLMAGRQVGPRAALRAGRTTYCYIGPLGLLAARRTRRMHIDGHWVPWSPWRLQPE
jgi:hypothetical protein